MKKIFSSLILGLFIMGLLSPFVLALDEPVQCCKLKHAIEIDGVEHGPGVGSETGYIKASGADCPPALAANTTATEVPNWAAYCSIDAIMTVADLIEVVAIVASGAALLIAGIMFASSAGSPERMGKAKKFLFGGLIGVLVIILSKFIAGFARFFFGI